MSHQKKFYSNYNHIDLVNFILTLTKLNFLLTRCVKLKNSQDLGKPLKIKYID